MTKKPTVALIGAGSMGGALLRGWLAGEVIAPDGSAIFDPMPSKNIQTLCTKYGVALNSPPDEVHPDALVAAVKPQLAGDVLPAFAAMAKDAIVISVMAGASVASIGAAIGDAPKIARVMPNLPAAIGKGVSGLYATDTIEAAGRSLIENLMAAVGETVWIDSEEGIDFVTAVSGSGPAYFFLLTEALAEAGEGLGLSKEAAAKLARATLTGAGALIEMETRSPAEMRRAVTSPGGTTEAALKVLDGDYQTIRKLIKEAVRVAAKRAGELTG